MGSRDSREDELRNTVACTDHLEARLAAGARNIPIARIHLPPADSPFGLAADRPCSTLASVLRRRRRRRRAHCARSATRSSCLP